MLNIYDTDFPLQVHVRHNTCAVIVLHEPGKVDMEAPLYASQENLINALRNMIAEHWCAVGPDAAECTEKKRG